jgi:hypothetical protein
LEEIMTRSRILIALTCSLLAAASYSLKADVRADEKARTEFGGAMGKIVNFFGGKSAREGVTSTVAVKGDRKSSINDTTGQIIDLAEEKVYDLDMKKKSYKITTFDELRRRMEEARKRAEENAAKQPAAAPKPTPAPAPDKNQKQMDIEFSLKETGQKKNLNGFETREIVMTITMHEKGKTLDEAGGIVLTSDIWMGPKIAAMREIPEFDRRYYQKLNNTTIVSGVSEEQMATAMAMYPMMKDAVSRMNTENVKMDGTAIQTVTTIDAVKSAEEVAQQQQSSEESKPQPAPTGLGGLLAKKMMQKQQEKKAQNDSPNRATIMTTTTEVLKVSTELAPTDVAIPAGFKENK